jgi:flagellar hook protein FlgE
MISTPAIALSGMQAAQAQLQASGHNIANLGTAGFRRAQVQTSAAPDGGVQATTAAAPAAGHAMETDMVGLLQAKNAFLANLAVFKTSEQMMGSLLDIRS